MQVDGVLRPKKEPKEAGLETARRSQSSLGAVDPKELDAIFERTYGPIRRERQGVGRVERSFRKEPEDTGKREIKLRKKEKEYLLVDGYNIIFAWEDLKALSEINLEAARGKLMDILSNLAGRSGLHPDSGLRCLSGRGWHEGDLQVS